MLVSRPEDYLYSSARNYADLDNLLDVVIIDKQFRPGMNDKIWYTAEHELQLFL